MDAAGVYVPTDGARVFASSFCPHIAMSTLCPSQAKVCGALVDAAHSKFTPAIELRPPMTLGRGYGVTTVLASAASTLGVPLIGLACTVASPGSALSALFDQVKDSFKASGTAVVDDIDLFCTPRNMKRSRTLLGALKNDGAMAHWESGDMAPSHVLKTLIDLAISSSAVLIFSRVEDSQAAFMQKPLAFNLPEPSAADYAAILSSCLGPAELSQVSPEQIFKLHGSLSPAELRSLLASTHSTGAPTTAKLLEAVRKELIASSAVQPDTVEEVDLAAYPGMDKLRVALEREVLFPLEEPEKAAELGLVPKRGVLIHGPPGTGKTTVGRWLAKRLAGKFFLVKEMMLQADIIRVFDAAKAAAPAIVFIDDADIVIGGWRPLDGHRGSDIFRFLLSRMDGLTSRGTGAGDVVVMLTGQDVRWMAGMLMRSGRIELWLKTHLPDGKTKRAILEKYISEDPAATKLLGEASAQNFGRVVPVCDEFTAADLRRLVSDAKVLAAYASVKMSDGASKDASFLEQAARSLRDMRADIDDEARRMFN